MQGNSVTIGRVFREGWNCFKARPWFWIGVMIVPCILSEIISLAASVIPDLAGTSSKNVEIAVAVHFLFVVLSMLVSIRIDMGLVWMGLSTVDGQATRFRDLFAKPHLSGGTSSPLFCALSLSRSALYC